MLPDEKVKCHRTGFQETCFRCVTEFKCQLWKRLPIEADRETGAVHREVYGCVDGLMHSYMLNLIGRQDTTTATVDNLRKEFATASDSGFGSALAEINSQLRLVAKSEGVQIPHSEAPKRLTDGKQTRGAENASHRE